MKVNKSNEKVPWKMIIFFSTCYISWVVALIMTSSSGRIPSNFEVFIILSIFIIPLILGIYSGIKKHNIIIAIIIHFFITFIIGWLLYTFSPKGSNSDTFIYTGIVQVIVINIEFSVSLLITKIIYIILLKVRGEINEKKDSN